MSLFSKGLGEEEKVSECIDYIGVISSVIYQYYS